MAEFQKLSVFLCHSPADKAAIRDLYNRLLKLSWVDPWLDEERLLPGHDRNAEIEKAVEKAHVVIIGLSTDSITKEGRTQAEFKYALKISLEKQENSIFIIPLNLEDLKDAERQIPSQLKDLQREDYFPNKRRVVAFDKILKSLKVRANALEIPNEEDKVIVSNSKTNKNKYSKENKTSENGVISSAEFPIHEIPFRKNPNFTGRQDILDVVHEEFSSARNTIPIYAISGMGGIGKTQIAIRYSYEFAKEYDLVYWIRSETDASLTADYEALTQALQLPVKTKAEQLVYINIVNNWLENTDKKWLLVFDNVEAQEKIEKLLPRKGNGHILVTSQSPNWKELGPDSQVRPFSDEVAKEFLKKRIGEKGLEHSDRLNELLGGLPLALDQASAYMTTHGTPVETYIKLFEEQQVELWKRETPPKEYKSTIMTTWEIAFKKIRESHPAAEQLLSLFSFFGPDDFPISIVTTYADRLPQELKKVANNSIELEENLSAIYRYSLAERNGGFISFHRLVQDVIRTRLSKEHATQWVGVAVQIMKMAFPFDEYEIKTWANCAQLLPHALATAIYAEKYSNGLEEGAEIYQKVGAYLREQGEYQRAGEALQHAINIRQEILEAKNEKIAISLDYLGEIRQRQAYYTEALSLHNQAFQILSTEDNLETQHSARNMNNLGQAFHYLGEFEKAKNHYEQSLTLYNTSLKERHPIVSMSLNNLGEIYRELGDFEKAQKYHEEALAIRQTTLGENHPLVAMSLSNLASVFVDMGEIEIARKYHEQSYEISIAILGENHPDVGMRLNNLGVTSAYENNLDAARKYYEKSYAIHLMALGENHPAVAAALHNIGSVLYDQSKYVEARQYFEKSLVISGKVYGVNHHRLLATLDYLAKVMLKLKVFTLARQYAERAMKICSESEIKYRECEQIAKLQKSIPLIGGKTADKKKKK